VKKTQIFYAERLTLVKYSMYECISWPQKSLWP